MERIVVVRVGVEGGGATVYGRQVEGQWVFWQEGSSMDLDENDDECWRGWESQPVSDLLAVLPGEWYEMFPIEVHPEFKALLRAEYERRAPAPSSESGTDWRQRVHKRWLDALT